MNNTLPGKSQPCLNRGGRPVHPAIVSLDAHVEALIAVGNDAEVLRHLAHLQVQMNRIGARVSQLSLERAERLESIVLPELRSGYEAAERAYGATA